ncbi:MAG: YbjN domain-containing protein [Pseudomonadota bacterium]
MRWFRSSAGAALFALAGAGLAVSGAHAEMIEAVTAEQLEAALDEAGLDPSIILDADTGAPVGQGKAGEFLFFVRALSCSGAPQACENLLFFANFNLGRAATPRDYQIVNQFNESQVFGRAYIIEGKNTVGVDYVIELGGGVSNDHLSENIGRWADVIAAFVTEFKEGHAGS